MPPNDSEGDNNLHELDTTVEFKEDQMAKSAYQKPEYDSLPIPPTHFIKRAMDDSSAFGEYVADESLSIPTVFIKKAMDDNSVFGEYVAAELRQLQSDEKRRKLKIIIQKAIVDINEEEEL